MVQKYTEHQGINSRQKYLKKSRRQFKEHRPTILHEMMRFAINAKSFLVISYKKQMFIWYTIEVKGRKYIAYTVYP